MPWLSKRELAYYLLLRSAFGYNAFNYGEAMDLLRLFGPRRVARKVLKRLVSRGFLEKVGTLEYRVKPLEDALEQLLVNYIANRLAKYMKSKGVELDVSVVGRDIVVKGCSDELKSIIEALRWERIRVVCS